MHNDTAVLASLPIHASSHVSAAPPARCIIPAESEYRRLEFRAPALNRLRQSTEWLCDECIELGAEAILRHVGTDSCRGDPVIFTPFALPKHKTGSDRSLWRLCKQSREFWAKDVWMFPIHRDGNHWTLVTVNWKKGRIAHFDSLNSRVAFKADIQV